MINQLLFKTKQLGKELTADVVLTSINAPLVFIFLKNTPFF